MVSKSEVIERFARIDIEIPEEHIFIIDDGYTIGFELYPKTDFTPKAIASFQQVAKDSIFEDCSLDEFVLPKEKYIFWYDTSLKCKTKISTEDEERFCMYLSYVLQHTIFPSENVRF